jgi:hypothetical protein
MFMLISLSGCATRALMSSDRYEKPEPEAPAQFHSSHSSMQSQALEQLYLAQHPCLSQGARQNFCSQPAQFNEH